MGGVDLRLPSPVMRMSMSCSKTRSSKITTNACFLSCHYTVLLFCVAIAAHAPFEGVMTFDSYRLPEIQSWGEGPT